MILPTPVPSIRNDKFKPIDEVICLVNVKDSDYNGNLICKDLSNSYIKDIQGTFEDDKSSLDIFYVKDSDYNGNLICSPNL